MIQKKLLLTGRYRLVLISLITALMILIIKILSTLLVYNFFSFDKYLTAVALFSLIIGYFLFAPRKSSSPIISLPNLTPPKDEVTDTLKNMRFSLTNREFTIFGLLAQGKTNKEISAELNVEVSTVKSHINNLYGKIDCNTRKDAIQRWAQLLDNKII